MSSTQLSDKPILIDALHICMGGGLMILNHLVNNLVKRKVNFVLLKDNRCPELESEDNVEDIVVLPPKFINRYKYYKHHKNDFRTVLCFGNIPPPIKLSVTVHTYLHNVSLLIIPKDYGFKLKLLAYLKKLVLKYLIKNTTDWVVQTTNTSTLLRNDLKNTKQPIFIYPFYFLPEKLTQYKNEAQRKDYVFVGERTNAKGHQYLIEAWVKLHRKGVKPKLHLTMRSNLWVKDAIAEGVNIENHGHIPFDQVIELYHKSKATIYPSLNESLGLGLIEAMAGGCDVIGCNLPYTHAICQPSCLFEAADPDSIVDAVLEYEYGHNTKTKPLVKDMISEFIDFLEAYK